MSGGSSGESTSHTPSDSFSVDSNSGQAIYAAGSGPIHAPYQVENYYASVVNNYAADDKVSWPVQVGLMPQLADGFQSRSGPQNALAEGLAFGGITVLTQTQVLTGLGGNGKTQLAAAHARELWNGRQLDLLAWITAANRDAVITGYAQVARSIGLRTDLSDPEQAATAFLSWAESTDKRWLAVLDDVSDPAHMIGLWPTGPSGRVIVTTRRHDHVLSGRNRKVIDVGLFTEDEALAYLAAKLSRGGNHPHALNQAGELVNDLGLLPLALAQASAVMAEQGWTCAEYRARFSDQRIQLVNLLPPDALADDYASGPHAHHRATIATTWALSIQAADQLQPVGLASPLLRLAAYLDPNGIPVRIFQSAVARSFISKPMAGGAQPSGREVDAVDVGQALSNLARFSLVDLDAPAAYATTVRVHALVQRAVRDSLDAVARRVFPRAVADSLVDAWPLEDYSPVQVLFASDLRINAAALRRNTAGLLRQGNEAHPLLFRIGESLAAAGLVDQAVEYWTDVVKNASNDLGSGHLSTLQSIHNLAHAYLAVGRFDDAITIYEAMLTEMEKVDTEHIGLWTSRNNLAGAYQEAGRFSEAVELHKVNLAQLEKALDPQHSLILTSRSNLAGAYEGAGQLEEAVRLYEKSLADREHLFGSDHRQTLSTRNSLGFAYLLVGRLDEAVQLLEEARAGHEQVLGVAHPATLASLNNLASAYHAVGRYSDAIEVFESNRIEVERALGPDHPNTFRSCNNLASAYQSAGRLEHAWQLYEATLSGRERVLGPLHPDTLTSRNDLAGVYQAMGKLEEAVQLHEATLSDREQILGFLHPDTLVSRNNLADAYHASGRLDEAVRLHETTSTDLERVLGPKHPLTLTSCNNLAGAYQAVGRLQEALRLLESTLADREQVSGAQHPETLACRNNLAFAYQEAGLLAEAVLLLEKALTDAEHVLGPNHPDTLSYRNRLAAARWEASRLA